MLQRLRGRIGNPAFFAVQILLGLIGFFVLCMILRASILVGLALAWHSLLYMLPFAGVEIGRAHV